MFHTLILVLSAFTSTSANTDIPDCENPSFTVGSTGAGIQFDFEEEVRPEHFNYEVNIVYRNQSSSSKVLNKGNVLIFTKDNLANRTIDSVKVRRVCFREEFTKTYYSDWKHVSLNKLPGWKNNNCPTLDFTNNFYIQCSIDSVTGQFNGIEIEMTSVSCPFESAELLSFEMITCQGDTLIQTFSEHICGNLFFPNDPNQTGQGADWGDTEICEINLVSHLATADTTQLSHCRYNMWSFTSPVIFSQVCNQIGVSVDTANQNGFWLNTKDGNVVWIGNGPPPGGTNGSMGSGDPNDDCDNANLNLPSGVSGGCDSASIQDLRNRCGDSITVVTPDCSQGTPVAVGSLSNGATVYLAGFAATVYLDDSGEEKAVVSLPFDNKEIVVSISDLLFTDINGEVHACDSWSITLVASNPNFPNSNTSSLECKVFEDTLPPFPNPHPSFNEDGTIKMPPYPGWQEGAPVDSFYNPCGFNSEGIHRVTGGRFNETGCDINGLTENGETCDPCEGKPPYYWKRSTEETSAGVDFYNENRNVINQSISSLTQGVIQNYSDSILVSRTNFCNQLRTEINNLSVMNTVANRPDLFGENDEYFNEGLSLNFDKNLIEYTPIDGTNRDSELEDLESLHKQLYDCDKQLQEEKRQYQLMDSLMQIQEWEEKLHEFIATRIKKLKEDEIEDLDLYQKIQELTAKFFVEVFEGRDPMLIASAYLKGHGSLKSLPTTGMSPLNVASQFSPYIRQLVKYEYTSLINSSSSVIDEFPLELGENDDLFSIKITKLTLSDTGSYIDAYVKVVLNEKTTLVFSGINIPVTPNGLKGGEQSFLRLESNISIPLNNVAALNFEADSTYAVFDCFGLQNFIVGGNIEFCEKYLLPVDQNNQVITEVSEEDRVKAYFHQLDLVNLREFYTQINVDPFAVKGGEQVVWRLEEAIVDMSSSQSYNDALLPKEYIHAHVESDPGGKVFLNEWKGFYLGYGSAFISKTDTESNDVSISVSNMAIDNRGFTGEVEVQTEILSLEESNQYGWAMSINSAHILIVQNRLRQGGFGGLINIPLGKNSAGNQIDSTDCFTYECIMGGANRFQFHIVNNKEIKSDLLIGNIRFEPGSSISIVGDTIMTSLNGSLELGLENDNIKGLGENVAFSNLNISNKAPYFRGGQFSSFNAGLSIQGFEVGARISLINHADTAKVRFDPANIRLGLGGDSDIAVTGSFDVDLIIDKDAKERQIWKFGAFTPHGFAIDADIAGNKIHGDLRWFRGDSTWGDGFFGGIHANFKCINGDISVGATFGRRPAISSGEEDFRYFMVDALWSSAGSSGIPLGVITLNKLGGGLRYGLDIQNLNNVSLGDNPLSAIDQPGQSLSGVSYVPSETTGLGFSIYAGGIIKKDALLQVNVEFGMQFHNQHSSHSGIKDIFIRGDFIGLSPAESFSGLTNATNSLQNKIEEYNIDIVQGQAMETSFLDDLSFGGAIRGNLYLSLGFGRETVLQGQLAADLNVGNIINGKLNAELYADDDIWYFNLGRLRRGNYTADHISDAYVDLNIPLIHVKIQTYFNLGNDLPPMPSIPTRLRSMFPNYTPPDLNLGRGNGIAFGSRLNFGFDANFFVASADLDVVAGFDVALKQYNNVMCANNSGTPTELGINGWYALGQIYLGAWFTLKVVGIKVFSGAVGAYAQAGLPNPTWIKARLAVQYRLFGSNKTARAKVNIGEQCSPIGGSFEEEKSDLISFIFPMDGASEVDTYEPQLSVELNNIPFNKKFNYDGDAYIVKLDTALLITRYGTFDISDTDSAFSDDPYVLDFDLDFLLPYQDSIELIVDFEVYKNGEPDRDNDLKVKRKRDTVTFITREGDDLDFSTFNITSTYPINGMNHFHQDIVHPIYEEKGGVNLKKRLVLSELDTLRFVAIWYNLDQPSNVKATRVETKRDKLLTFVIPELQPSTGYRLDIVPIDSELYNQMDFSDDDIVLSSLENAFDYSFGIDPYELEYPESSLTILFSTSEYNTFKAKMDDWFVDSTYNLPIDRNTMTFNIPISVPEGFDKLEFNYDSNSSFASADFNPRTLAFNESTLVRLRLDFSAFENGGTVNVLKNERLLIDEEFYFNHVTDCNNPKIDSSVFFNDWQLMENLEILTNNNNYPNAHTEHSASEVRGENIGEEFIAPLPDFEFMGIDNLKGMNEKIQSKLAVDISPQELEFEPLFSGGSTESDGDNVYQLKIAYYKTFIQLFYSFVNNASKLHDKIENCSIDFNYGSGLKAQTSFVPTITNINETCDALRFLDASSQNQFFSLKERAVFGNCMHDFFTGAEPKGVLNNRNTAVPDLFQPSNASGFYDVGLVNRYYQSIAEMPYRSQLKTRLILEYVVNGVVLETYSTDIIINTTEVIE